MRKEPTKNLAIIQSANVKQKVWKKRSVGTKNLYSYILVTAIWEILVKAVQVCKMRYATDNKGNLAHTPLLNQPCTVHIWRSRATLLLQMEL